MSGPIFRSVKEAANQSLRSLAGWRREGLRVREGAEPSAWLQVRTPPGGHRHSRWTWRHVPLYHLADAAAVRRRSRPDETPGLLDRMLEVQT